MPQCELAVKPLVLCVKRRPQSISIFKHQHLRCLTNSVSQKNVGRIQREPVSKDTDATALSTSQSKSKPVEAANPVLGRRQAALQQSANIPFEQLPYQCFQEARKILQADREEKLKQIEVERARIARLKGGDTTGITEHQKRRKLQSMQHHLEKLKIWADFNDPLVKKKFEDGKGDMNKPIYRFLADRKWREYRRPILMQRLNQMHVIPDVLPTIDPTSDVRLYFRRFEIKPGDFVQSTLSEASPRLNIQLFEKGEKLVTIAVIDSDVPNLEKDGFDYNCHFLAVNVPISPSSTNITLASLSQNTQVVLPWKAPHAQKGSPYHRLSTFVFEQQRGEISDVALLKEKTRHTDFVLRSFATRQSIHPIGAHLFRTQWDEGTAGVMGRAGVEGADIQLKRARIEPLPYKRRNPPSMR